MSAPAKPSERIVLLRVGKRLTRERVRELIEQYGTVVEFANAPGKNKTTGQPLPFFNYFVTMGSVAEARDVIAHMDGMDVNGHPIHVNFQKPARTNPNPPNPKPPNPKPKPPKPLPKRDQVTVQVIVGDSPSTRVCLPRDMTLEKAVGQGEIDIDGLAEWQAQLVLQDHGMEEVGLVPKGEPLGDLGVDGFSILIKSTK